MTTSPITDIWFRSGRSLAHLARDLGLRDTLFDGESYWEWVIGTFDGVQLDVTRAHKGRPEATDTRIFRYDNGRFDDALKRRVLSRLEPVVAGPIHCGRWIYRSGNDFDREVVRTTLGREGRARD